jgi:hypothetical protein
MEEIPVEIALILKRALVWSGNGITPLEREKAWAWVEKEEGYYDEMGG